MRLLVLHPTVQTPQNRGIVGIELPGLFYQAIYKEYHLLRSGDKNHLDTELKVLLGRGHNVVYCKECHLRPEQVRGVGAREED